MFIFKRRGSRYGSLSFQQTVTDAQRRRRCREACSPHRNDNTAADCGDDKRTAAAGGK